MQRLSPKMVLSNYPSWTRNQQILTALDIILHVARVVHWLTSCSLLSCQTYLNNLHTKLKRTAAQSLDTWQIAEYGSGLTSLTPLPLNPYNPENCIWNKINWRFLVLKCLVSNCHNSWEIKITCTTLSKCI